MSRLFGALRQMGYVVRDIEAAMHHWVDVCGVGPWFYVDRLPLTAFTYRGARHDGLHVSIALANSGDVQLELIQQRCDTPSMYRDFLAAGREGLQHWSSWPEDYDARHRRALASGYQVGQEGDSPRGRFVYFAAEGHPGTVIEMAHLTPARRRIFDQIRAAAVGWDGRARTEGGSASSPSGSHNCTLLSPPIPPEATRARARPSGPTTDATIAGK